MKIRNLIIGACAISLGACANANAGNNIAVGDQLRATTPEGRTVVVEFIDAGTVKVSNFPQGQEIPQANVIHPEPYVICPHADINIDLNPEGILLITDNDGGLTFTDNGKRPIENGHQRIDLATDSRGAIYGGGERGHKINLRGDTLVNFNRQNYGYTGSDPRISQMGITMPVYLSADGYGIVFDDFAPSSTILGDTISYISENPEAFSYYLIFDESLAGLAQMATNLTGRQPLPPLWTLGYITSRYGYKTQAETEAVVDTFKTRGYPLDGIVLDLYWFGQEQDMGRLAWDSENWPDPAAMAERLHQKGVKLVTVSEPYVLRNGRGIDNYRALTADSLLLLDAEGNPQEVTIWVGEGGMFDMSNPKTRQWLGDLYHSLAEMGVDGFWGDLGEPEVHPESGVHHNGLSARLYHNKYGNDWASIISEMYEREYPGRRHLTLMRGGTTGLQKYGVFPWSTDVSRSWGGLEPQVRIMINSGLSGLGYMGSDIGGFAVDPEAPYDPELYVRWMQLGLFSPMLRTHAQQFAEPYQYPQQEEILRNIVKERYRWLPYNYTLAYENAHSGAPMVKPIFVLGENVPDSITDQYLWGWDVMVAPVIEQGATSRTIFFPGQSFVPGPVCETWIDLNHPERSYRGGTTVADYPTPLGEIPHFVRAGAIIPMAEYPMENTGQYRNDEYTVHFYPDKSGEGSGNIYIDDLTSSDNITYRNFLNLSMYVRNNIFTAHNLDIRPPADAPETIRLNIITHRGNQTTEHQLTLSRADNYRAQITL